MNKKSLLLISALVVTCSANAQERSADPLQPLVKCLYKNEYHFDKTDRLPPQNTSRTVDTANGPARITTADGYRILIYRKSTAPLVNLKIELSSAGHFDADRSAIIAQLEAISATTKAPHKVELEKSMQDGIEVLALNNASAEHSPGVVALYTLLDARNNIVATAYMLNQSPKTREFSNDAQYEALRADFIALLGDCMTHSLSSK